MGSPLVTIEVNPMPPRKKLQSPDARARFVADVKREQAQRQKTYREQALALFPHVCARCGREFTGKRLRELTVHHKDSDHMNNPPDGSNWELLCIYCHDDAHLGGQQGGYNSGYAEESGERPSLDYQPFAGLKDLLKPQDDESEPQ